MPKALAGYPAGRSFLGAKALVGGLLATCA